MSECIHCDIHDLLETHPEADDATIAEIACKVAEVLADLILTAPPTDRAALMAEIIANLGQFVLEKNDDVTEHAQVPRRLGH